MTKITDYLKEIDFFKDFSNDEKEKIAGITAIVEKKAGELVFNQGDAGGSMMIVAAGKVKISTVIAGDVQRTLLTLSKGGVLGELSLISGELRTARAMATEDCSLLAIERDQFQSLTESENALAVKIQRQLLEIIVRRLNNTTELYRQAATWSLEISGAVELSCSQLIAEKTTVNVQLMNSQSISGKLLKHDKENGEIWLRCNDGTISIIPRHALAQLSFAGSLVPGSSTDDSQENV